MVRTIKIGSMPKIKISKDAIGAIYAGITAALVSGASAVGGGSSSPRYRQGDTIRYGTGTGIYTWIILSIDYASETYLTSYWYVPQVGSEVVIQNHRVAWSQVERDGAYVIS